MKKLIAQRYVVRQNLLAIIGFILCCYFGYHAVLGQRSYIRLLSLERQISETTTTADHLTAERIALEGRVKMLRPGSIDRDLLEERARYVLGYSYDNERIVITN